MIFLNIHKFTDTFLKNGLQAAAARGGAILGLAGCLEHLTRLARNAILARILAPELFGVMAIVISFGSLLQSLTEAGVQYAIIQNPRGRESSFLNVAWWFSVTRGIVLYSLTFLFAPMVARFYGNSELTLLIRVAGLSVLLNGCMNVALFARMKTMEFRPWALASSGGSIVAQVATILLAFYMPTVWILVFGLVSDVIVRCALSYIVCPFAPTFKLEREHLRALLGYSRNFAGLPILYALSRMADIFVLGKLSSSSLIGLYSLSKSLAGAPLDFLKSIVSQVAMPVFSSVQDDKIKLEKAILQGVSLLASAVFPALAFIWVYGGSVLAIIYGHQYSAARIPFAVLFTIGAIEVVGIPMATLYFAIGKPQLHRLFSLVRTSVLLATIVPATLLLGWNGTAFSALLASLVGYSVQTHRIRFFLGTRIRDIAKCLVVPSLCTFSALPIWLLGETLHPSSPVTRGVVAGGGLFFAYCLAIISILSQKRKHSNTAVLTHLRGQ